MTTNNNRQKKQHYFCIKQNKQISKKHRGKKEITTATNLNDFPSPRNFCAAETQGIRLCVPATAHKHCTVSPFSQKKKQRKAHPGVSLAPIKSWRFLLKKIRDFVIGQSWCRLCRHGRHWSTVMLTPNNMAGYWVTAWATTVLSFNLCDVTALGAVR